MKVQMTACDNPRCANTGVPENDKPYRPPYAWLTAKGGFFGCGPSFNVEVCTLPCLEPAIEEAIAEAGRTGR